MEKIYGKAFCKMGISSVQRALVQRMGKALGKAFGCLVFALGLSFCCGCSATELEQRSFPLAVGIDLEEEQESLIVSFDFPDLAQISEKGKTADTPMALSLEGADLYHVEKSYENNTNRLLDYNHMKAVVLGEGLMKQEETLRSLLLAWEQREASARNTSLLLGSSSASEVLSLTSETEGSMGKYLEEMLESQKDFKQNKIITMGDLMNQWHNQDELLLIPVLTENGDRPVITGYAAISDFAYRGTLSVKEAMESFLAQGLLERFTCEPAENEVVEISNIQVSCEIEEEGELPVVTVSIRGQGRLKTGQANSSSERYRLEEKVEKALMADLRETSQRLQENYGIDMVNSYLLLGGHNRELYGKYKDFAETYNREVQQVFRVDISLLNWE